jgi:hypothetical protein
MGRSAYGVARRQRRTFQGMPLTNRDLLAWFSEDERSECEACGEKACVSLPDALAAFCLACGAITVDAVRIDVGGRVPAAGA